MVSSSSTDCFFVRNDIAATIWNKIEFSALNKMEKSIDGIMIKKVCWKLETDRLGRIIKVNGSHIKPKNTSNDSYAPSPTINLRSGSIYAPEWQLDAPDAKPMLPDAKPMLRNGKPMLKDGKLMLKDGKPMLKDAKPMLRNAKPMLKDGKLMLKNGIRELFIQKVLTFKIRKEDNS